MCNTNMSVSTDGAVSTSQIPASEQETLTKAIAFEVVEVCWCTEGHLYYERGYILSWPVYHD